MISVEGSSLSHLWKESLITGLVVALACVMPQVVWAADAGSEAFREGNYEAAIEYYNRILAEKDLPEAAYNLGNALYKQGKIDEAISAFERSLSLEKPEAKARVMYNLGNAMANAQKYEQSLAFYQRALELQPGDMDAKYNLELIRRKLQQQQQQEQQPGNNPQQNEDQREEQNTQEREGDSDKQNRQGDNQQEQQGQDQQQQNRKEEQEQQEGRENQSQAGAEEQQSEQQQQQQDEGQEQEGRQHGQVQADSTISLDRKEAQQILNALRLNQDKVMKAQIRKKLKQVKTDKDW